MVEHDALPGAVVLAAWTLIARSGRGAAAPLLARDPGLYRRARSIANRIFLAILLPAGGLVGAGVAIAERGLLPTAILYLVIPSGIIVTRLIELVALWIAPDGR